jgi:hypothetical protein
MKTLGEHRSFGGVQGFYEHDSSEGKGALLRTFLAALHREAA